MNTVIERKYKTVTRVRGKPAGAFDLLHELGDELLAEVGPEITRVQLYLSL